MTAYDGGVTVQRYAPCPRRVRALSALVGDTEPVPGSSDAEFRVVRCRAHLSFATESDGGLRQPLTLPTQSIVFKFVDGEIAGRGAVAIVESADTQSVSGGSVIDADVTFPDAPPREKFQDREFTLWAGRDLGTAIITEVW